ncbi:CidA/LrgA family protein [Methylocystis bryophila]|uniref:CidA/LrgA family protein n=1 Tax=Methylocystis bryophila TaxID=655015 RepID=A0A1W6MWQ3_9HYPH|nr:CidA/LrgA family protein [Methylocystis bryophila]ARN82017.1 hypothetical protein B1812_14070 [Methylocystis bryophila]BDV38131.1 hypothetical protein DSM21852_13840 [Methylocystis bryophila]
MPERKTGARPRAAVLELAAQLCLLMGFWLIGKAFARLLGLPVPGAIIGLLLVLALLSAKVVSLSALDRGADLLLAEMVLFFIPALMAIFDHHELFGLIGLKILIMILASTGAVLAVTAIVVDLCTRALPARTESFER